MRRELNIYALALALTSALVFSSARSTIAQDGVSPLNGAPSQNYWEQIYDPGRPAYEALMNQAWAAVASGEFEALESRIAALKKMRPRDEGTRFFEAILAERKGDYKRSVSIIEVLIKEGNHLDVEPETLYFDLAYGYTRLSRLEDAVAAYEKSLASGREGDTRHVTLSNLAELYMALGDLDRAISTWREALDKNDSYVHAIFGLAMAFERKGQHDIARAYTLTGVGKDPRLEQYLNPNTFFVPEQDQAFVRGLIAEELGQWQQARQHFARYNTLTLEGGGRYLDAGKIASGRVAGLGDPLIAKGPLPIASPVAVAVDPKGRAVAMGDRLGRVVLTNLAQGKVVSTPSLSGGPVKSLAYDTEGKKLFIARGTAEIEVVDVASGKLVKSMTSISAPSSANIVQGISSDGRAFLSTRDRNARAFSVGLLRGPRQAKGSFSLKGHRDALVIGPWSESRQSVAIATWMSDQSLEVRHSENPRVMLKHRPLPTRHHAMTMTPDGRFAILASLSRVIVCRIADLQVVKTIAMTDEDSPDAEPAGSSSSGFGIRGRQDLHDPISAAFDFKGGAGHGPALLVFFRSHYVAYKTSALGLD